MGTPHSISFVSTDPDGDSVRYLIDWDADGSVDQIVPPSGYVSSGTTQSASRTYATEGSKTVKVRSEDDNGSLSSWASLTFTCSDVPPPPPPPPASQCSDTLDNDSDGLVDSLDPDCSATAGFSEFPTDRQPPADLTNSEQSPHENSTTTPPAAYDDDPPPVTSQ